MTSDQMLESVGALTRAAQMVGLAAAQEVGHVTKVLQQHIDLDRNDAPEITEAVERLEQIEVQLVRYAVANGWSPNHGS